MNHLHYQDRPDLVFEKMDATDMIYNDNNFNVILDKGMYLHNLILIFNFTKKNILNYFFFVKRDFGCHDAG